MCLEIGELEEAEENLIQSLNIAKDIGFVRDIVNLVLQFAQLKTARGQHESAVELLALVIQHPASQLYRMLEGKIRDSARSLLAELEKQLSPEQFSAAQERGQRLDLDDVANQLISPKANQ